MVQCSWQQRKQCSAKRKVEKEPSWYQGKLKMKNLKCKFRYKCELASVCDSLSSMTCVSWLISWSLYSILKIILLTFCVISQSLPDQKRSAEKVWTIRQLLDSTFVEQCSHNDPSRLLFPDFFYFFEQIVA